MGLIKSGNYNSDGKYRQWRVGDFIDDPLFNSKKTEVKWSANLKKGTIRNEPGYQRLLSTLVIHVKGKIKITFPHESREETLKKRRRFRFLCTRGLSLMGDYGREHDSRYHSIFIRLRQTAGQFL